MEVGRDEHWLPSKGLLIKIITVNEIKIELVHQAGKKVIFGVARRWARKASINDLGNFE